MGFDIFIKNEFLNQSIGQFTDKMGMMSKVDICNVIVQNKSWYVSKSVMRKALANNDDKVSSIFKKIDGRVLNRDAIFDGKESVEVRRADNLVEKQEIGILCYPNPSSGEIHISIDFERLVADEIAIYDVLGRKVFALPCQFDNANPTITFNPHLKAGVYVLRIGEHTQKIVRYQTIIYFYVEKIITFA